MFGTLITHDGVEKFVNPSLIEVRGDYPSDEDGFHGFWYEMDSEDWVLAGYSVAWGVAGADDYQAGLGVDGSLPIGQARMIRPAAEVVFQKWDDSTAETFRIDAIKNLKLRCVYRPILLSDNPGGEFGKLDGCKLAIDGGTVTTTPADGWAGRSGKTKIEYFNFKLNDELDGYHYGLFVVDIVSAWPWDLEDDWISIPTGSNLNRITEVCMSLGLSTDLSVIAEMNWDQFEDFVNA